MSKYCEYYCSETKILQTSVYSVFDLMYDDYSPILTEMKKRLLNISEFASENIIATIIQDICESGEYGALSYRFNYPLRAVIKINSLTDNEDIKFVRNINTHCDFVIYNTCTVRENANNKVYGRLGYLSNYKKKNPHMMIALCGCMMQEPSVIEKIKTSYRFVDLIFGTHNIFKFAELLANMMDSDDMIVDIWKDTDKIVVDLTVSRKYPFK